MAELNFDANTVEPNVGFEPVPAGDYKVVIVESEMKPTRDGKGERLALKLQIVEGPYEGRPLFDGLNLKNPSEEAVKIAKGTLSAICRAVGKMTPKASEELHNIPMIAKVDIKPAKDGYEAQNRIKGYKPLAAAKPSVPSAAPKTAPWK